MLDINAILEHSFQETDTEKKNKELVLEEHTKLGDVFSDVVNGVCKPKGGKGKPGGKPITESTLNISLDEIEAITELKTNYSDELIANIAAAFSIDRIVEETIIDNILNTDDYINTVDVLDESKGIIKKVVRSGEIKEKLFCPEGFRSDNGKCVKMAASEVTRRHKAAKIAARTRKSSYGSARMSIMKSFHKSLKVRDKKASILVKTRPGG